MDLNNVINSIGGAANNVLSGIGQGIGNVANGIGGIVQNFAKGLNDDWQNAQQSARQIPQDISNNIPQQIQQPVQQGLSNLTGNVRNVTQYPQVAQTLPDDVRQSLIDMTNRISPMLPLNQQLPAQFVGQTAANLTGTFARGLAAPFTQKPLIEKAGDIAGGIGAVAMPASAVGMGVFNTAFNPTIGSMLQGQMPHVPTPEETAQNYQQGIQFGAQYGPIAKVLSPLTNPVSAKLAPAGVTGLKGLGQRMIGGGIAATPAMAAVGAIQPAESNQERLQNIQNMTLQGLTFGAIGGTLAKPSLPALSERYAMNKSQTTPDQTFASDNGIKYTGKALDTYEKLVPRISQQQQEFAVDPDGAMRKMLPQQTYDQWYKAQPMNHSEGGNAVLKDARGHFGYINPTDMPQHLQDTKEVMDHFGFDQLTANQGYPELAVVRQTYDANGNPNPLDITDGHHRFPIGRDIGLQKIPAVILDDSQPLLRDQFNHIKGIQEMTIGQMQPTQRGLVSPYSGGAEANLAYLQQPGTENPQAGFLNLGANVGGDPWQQVFDKAKQSGVKSLTPDESKLLYSHGIDVGRDIKANALPGFGAWHDNILGHTSTTHTPTELAPEIQQYINSGAVNDPKWNYSLRNPVNELIPPEEKGNFALKNAMAKAQVAPEALTPKETDAVNLTYLNRIKALQQENQAGFLNLGANVGGEEANVRNLKTPQAQVPSDIGDQENILGNQPVMAEQGNVLAGMRTLNQVRPTGEVPSSDEISNKQLALNQIKAGIPTPKGKLPDLGMQQLNQVRLQQNPDFYGTQANAPTDGSPRPPAQLSQVMEMKSTIQDNLTNAKLLQDNYDQYRIQAQQQGDKPATQTQLAKYIKTLQKNANALDSRIKTLQPDNPLIQNQIQASQDASQAMKIAQDAAAQNGAQVSARIKSVESQADQMDRKGKTSTQINDNLGFRVIAPTQAQADAALEQIKANPYVKVVKQENVSDPNTGYAANHLDIRIGDSPQITEYQGMTEQMAKLAQDTHDQYKVLDNPPTRVQLRQLTQLGYQPDQLSRISQDDAKGIIKTRTPPAPPDVPDANPPTVPQESAQPVDYVSSMKQALYAKFSAEQQIALRGTNVLRDISAGVRGSAETEAFRQAMEHPEQAYALAQNARDPNAFMKATQTLSNFTDFVHQLAGNSGMNIGDVKDYYTHILDLSDPAMKAKLDELMAAKQKAGNYQGWFTKERIFNDIDELRQQGFKLKNDTAPMDWKAYIQAATKSIGNSAFLQELHKSAPNDISATNFIDKNGSSAQSTLPGLQGTYMSVPLTKAFRSLVGDTMDRSDLAGDTPLGRVGHWLDVINKAGKTFRLAGGTFHVPNETFAYLGRETANFRPANLPRIYWSALTEGNYANAVRGWADSGKLAEASNAGIDLSKSESLVNEEGKVQTGANPLNPFTQLNEFALKRLPNIMKMELWDHANIDTSTPEGLAKGRQIASQINNIISGPNGAVGDDVLKSRVIRALSRQALLAPQYQQGRIASTVGAVKGVIPGLSNAGNRYATGALLGRVAVQIAIAAAAQKIVRGKFDSTLQDWANHTIADPQFPEPFTNNKGLPVVGQFPGSELSDIYRMWNDPAHYLISHSGSLISSGIQGVTNQNYYGQNLTDPNVAPQGMIPDTMAKLGALGVASLPPPITQGIKALSGQVNWPTALSNEIGFRVKQADTNPGVVWGTTKQQYYNQLTQEQKQNFDYINPTKTDPYTGQPIDDPSIQQSLLNTPAKAMALLKAENLQGTNFMKIQGDFEKAVAAKTGQQYDPIYDLTPAQQHDVNLMRSSLPGQDTTQKKLIAQRDNAWYPAFQAKENLYYASLPQTQRISMTPNTLADPATQTLLDQYNALPTSTDKHNFLLANPSVASYFTKYDAARIQEQVDLGLIPTASSATGGTSRSSSSSLSSSYDQAYLDRALLRQMLLMRMPVAAEQKVPSLFLAPGQSATSRPIMNIMPRSAPQKPNIAIRYGQQAAQPNFGRASVTYKRPRFVQNLKSMGGVS